MDTGKIQIEVVIEYDGFIAGRELSDILFYLDLAIWQSLRHQLSWGPNYSDDWDDWPDYAQMRWHDVPPRFCISAATEGSLILHLDIGRVALDYCLMRFGSGFIRSNIGTESERLGKNVGDHLGEFIGAINDWMDRYTKHADKNKSNIRMIKARQKQRKEKKTIPVGIKTLAS